MTKKKTIKSPFTGSPMEVDQFQDEEPEKPQRLEFRCIKCGSDGISISFVINILECSCNRCGYKWNEKTLDER